MPAQAGWGVEIPYLIRIITENVKRYKQLQQVIKDTQKRDDYNRWINQGLDNAAGIVVNLPIEDEKILGHLKNFDQTLKAVEKLYGKVPKGPESSMLELHDKTIAEAIKVINSSRVYAKKQIDYYNNERLHGSIFKLPPIEFIKNYYKGNFSNYEVSA